ncbi:cytochrome P450, partial [Leucogyrophana mollusca]
YPIHFAVLHETLRLWPGVQKNARLALSDDVLPSVPEQGYHLPVRVSKGDYVLWSDYAMMRNCKVWGPDAREFNPDRHLDVHGQFVKPPQPKFHAFGAGPRLCPGSRLTTYEFISFWAALLPVFNFVPIEARERFPTDALTTSMEGPFMVVVKSRL